ncbi:MAG: hypothetical protein C0467_14095 [Planctomycetaceae bacterium]|nr:hypothetical protein [Planctomycetaceae bacterium]
MIKAIFHYKDDPIKKIAHLKKGLQNKAMRIACNKAASPVKAEIVAQAPVDTGALKKSIRIKVKDYKSKQVWIVVIGASNKFKRKNKRPANYAHLVNKGTKTIQATHFMSFGRTASAKRFPERYCSVLKEQIAILLK